MPNKVFLGENDIIFNLYEGNQAQESIQNMVNENNRIITKLRRQNKPVLVLADLTKLGQSSIGSRQASADALKNKDYDKVALFGANKFMKYVGNFIITASGQERRARMFDTEDEAMAWLKNGKQR